MKAVLRSFPRMIPRIVAARRACIHIQRTTSSVERVQSCYNKWPYNFASCSSKNQRMYNNFNTHAYMPCIKAYTHESVCRHSVALNNLHRPPHRTGRPVNKSVPMRPIGNHMTPKYRHQQPMRRL